jgi:hypothetical protein
MSLPIRRLILIASALLLAACGTEDGVPMTPPGTNPPGTNPPGTNPPGTNPPGTNPPGTNPTPLPPAATDPSKPLFVEDQVIDLHLTFAAGDWARLLAPMGAEEARYVPCVFRFGTETVTTAACRRKGNDAYWNVEKKPQLVVRFNLFDKTARFHGLRRLNLEAFHDTPAPVRDRLGMWIMREAGVDASRVNHARVYKDGQLLGLYMNIEAVDHEFLENHFPKASSGNLWESAIELKTNETAPDLTRLMELEALLDAEPLEGDHAAFFAKLDAVMDVDQVIREMAAETAALADDNFANGGANYYLYDHPQRGFMVLPWDFDTMFVADVDADPFAFWDGASPNKLRQLINQNPTWKNQFVTVLADIRDKVLPRLPAFVDTVCGQIGPSVRMDVNRDYSYEEFEQDCQSLKALVPQRVTALKRMLGR